MRQRQLCRHHSEMVQWNQHSLMWDSDNLSKDLEKAVKHVKNCDNYEDSGLKCVEQREWLKDLEYFRKEGEMVEFASYCPSRYATV